MQSDLSAFTESHTQPLPKRASPAEAAERFADCRCERARGSPAGRGGHQLPEEAMVPMSAAIIADRAANRLRHSCEVCNQGIKRLRSQLRRAFKGLVEIRNVGSMMLVVVDFHRLGIDIRLECGGGVGKCG